MLCSSNEPSVLSTHLRCLLLLLLVAVVGAVVILLLLLLGVLVELLRVAALVVDLLLLVVVMVAAGRPVKLLVVFKVHRRRSRVRLHLGLNELRHAARHVGCWSLLFFGLGWLIWYGVRPKKVSAEYFMYCGIIALVPPAVGGGPCLSIARDPPVAGDLFHSGHRQRLRTTRGEGRTDSRTDGRTDGGRARDRSPDGRFARPSLASRSPAAVQFADRPTAVPPSRSVVDEFGFSSPSRTGLLRATSAAFCGLSCCKDI